MSDATDGATPMPEPPFPIPLPAQWTSPLWWAVVINFVLSEIIAFATAFHLGITHALTAVSQGEIVMAAQGFAVVGFVVYGIIHHQQVKAAMQANAHAQVAYYNALAQVHYNEAIARLGQRPAA